MQEKYPVKIMLEIEISDFFELNEKELESIEQEHKFPKNVKDEMLWHLARLAQGNTFSDYDVYVKVLDENNNSYIYQGYGRI